eukprot:5264127-Pyramimonas_sp.AAC.1
MCFDQACSLACPGTPRKRFSKMAASEADLGDNPVHARHLHGIHVTQSLAEHLGREGRGV